MPPLPENYQQLSSAEKQEILWKNVTSDPYPDDKLPWLTSLPFYTRAIVKGLLSVRHLRTSFLRADNELPKGRLKIIHPFGTTCCVRIDPVEGHKFTGIFSSGAIGLMRFSLAYPGDSFVPGIGVKWLIDGRPSVNTVAMHSLIGFGADHNFFADDAVNPAPVTTKGIALGLLHSSFNKTALSLNAPKLKWNHMPVDAWASFRSDGTEVEDPVVPWGLSFTPVPETQHSSDAEPDFRIKFKDLKSGSKVWKLMALHEDGSDPIHIADIYSTSECCASNYNDYKLFFQHLAGPTTDA